MRAMRAKSEIPAAWWFLVACCGLLAILFMPILVHAEPGREEGQGRMVVPGSGKIITDIFGTEVTVPVEVPNRADFVPMGVGQKDEFVLFVFGREGERAPVYVETYLGGQILLFIMWDDAKGVTHIAYDSSLDDPEPSGPSGVFKLKTLEEKKTPAAEPTARQIHFLI